LTVLGMAACLIGADAKLLLIMRLTAGEGHLLHIPPRALAHLTCGASGSSSISLD
jgi:hypothetical protein